MKKIFVALLVILVIGALSVSFALSKFPDTISTKYDTAVEKLTNLNVITGFPDGTFKPGEAVTRAQLAKMLVEGLHLKNVTEVALYQFSDLTDKHWGYNWIKTAVDNNLIVGYPDGTFKPDNTVTYAETMAMVLRALNLESSMTDKSWPTGYMNAATAQGLLNDVSYSNPNAPANRGEVSISLYNMVIKIEKQEKEEEAKKVEEEIRRKQEAKDNEMDFGIVASTTYSKSTYTVKLDGDKTKWELYSINGASKLTDSKVEALENNVIGYQDTKNGMEVNAVYKPSDFDKAVVISNVETDTITFKDKTTWNIKSNSTLYDKYKYYTFIRVTADYDEETDDGLIYFTDVKKLGMGIADVKFVKNERVLVDDTHNVIVFLKGISASATIKKGKVNGGSSSSETSEYDYGWVTSVTTGKTDHVKINKVNYEVYSRSDEFEEDTFVIFEVVDSNSSNDVIDLVKAYGTYSIDSSCKVIQSVSGTKAGSQKVTFRGDSSATDFYSTTNVKKYKDYGIGLAEVKKDKSGYVTIEDTEIVDSLSDVKFYKGDRMIIDTKNEVIVIFQGLSEEEKFKNGKYTGEYDGEDEEVTYTISYKWEDATLARQIGAALPTSEKVKAGSKYTAALPKAVDGYTFSAEPATIAKVTANTQIMIRIQEQLNPIDYAKQEMDAALRAYDNACTDLDEAIEARDVAQAALGEAEEALTALQQTVTEKKAAKEAAEIAAEDDPENEEKQAAKRVAIEEYAAAIEARDAGAEAVTAAQTALTNAEAEVTYRERAKQEALENYEAKKKAYEDLLLQG